MPHIIHTYTNIWLEWHQVMVEIDSNKSLPTIDIIWLPDAAIKESKERVRATFRNCGIQLPPRKIILNLAPSDVRKVWTRFDLPIAVAILRLLHTKTSELDELEQFLDKTLFLWELWLDGTVKRVNWVLPSVISAYKKWWTSFVVPDDNANELQYIPNVDVYSVSSFQEIVHLFETLWTKESLRVHHKELSHIQKDVVEVDFRDIKWHLLPKRALKIAASGMHNILMSGPPWSGKSMLAKALSGILPPLTFDQVIDVSQVYSVIGKLGKHHPLITKRPFRSVHHTASRISIVGWWRQLTPGEVSLAHHGILFFDELPEFPRDTLEVLRQPLEDKKVLISRVVWSVEYPANFMFVAAMNPCKCGFFKDRKKQCICSLHEVKRYQSKISGPLLDRFDMILEVPRVDIDTILSNDHDESSADIQEQVMKARYAQKKRYEWQPFVSNAHISPKMITKFITLEEPAELFLKDVVKRLSLSPRVSHRAIKLAMTIADLAWDARVHKTHIAEALQYREKTMFAW